MEDTKNPMTASLVEDTPIIDTPIIDTPITESYFNTPIVISQLFEGVRVINSTKEGMMALTAADLELLKTTFHAFFFDILGLDNEEGGGDNSKLSESLVELILNMRNEAKSNKDYATSDKLRDALAAIQIQIKDSKEGTSWTYEG